MAVCSNLCYVSMIFVPVNVSRPSVANFDPKLGHFTQILSVVPFSPVYCVRFEEIDNDSSVNSYGYPSFDRVLSCRIVRMNDFVVFRISQLITFIPDPAK